MTGIIIAIVVLLIFCLKPASARNELLSRENSGMLKGVMAIMVLIHHIADRTSTGVLFHPFSNFGYAAVGVFLFLSGYGLQISYLKKGEKYSIGYFKKRIPAILFPYILINLIYWLVYTVNGDIYTPDMVFFSIILGDIIVPFSWYMTEILVLYLFFGLFMKMKSKKNDMIIRNAVVVLLFSVGAFVLDMGYWWYVSNIPFVVGVIAASYSDEIMKKTKKYMWLIALISLIGFIVLHVFFYGSTLFMNVASVMFTVFVVALATYVEPRFGVLNFLGDMSLEIYLMQGMFIVVLANLGGFRQNDFLWALYIIVGTLVSAFVVHCLNKLILKQYRKLVK